MPAHTPDKNYALRCIKEEDLEFVEYKEPKITLWWKHFLNESGAWPTFRLDVLDANFRKTKYYDDFILKEIGFQIKYWYGGRWLYLNENGPRGPQIKDVPSTAKIKIETNQQGLHMPESDTQYGPAFSVLMDRTTWFSIDNLSYDKCFKVQCNELPDPLRGITKLDLYEKGSATFNYETHDCFRKLQTIDIKIVFNPYKTQPKYHLSNIFSLDFKNASKFDVCNKFIYNALINEDITGLPKQFADFKDVPITLELD